MLQHFEVLFGGVKGGRGLCVLTYEHSNQQDPWEKAVYILTRAPTSMFQSIGAKPQPLVSETTARVWQGRRPGSASVQNCGWWVLEYWSCVFVRNSPRISKLSQSAATLSNKQRLVGYSTLNPYVCLYGLAPARLGSGRKFWIGVRLG